VSLNNALGEQTRELKGVDTGDGHCPKGSLPKVKEVKPERRFKTGPRGEAAGKFRAKLLPRNGAI
jgi:hypothetical protein